MNDNRIMEMSWTQLFILISFLNPIFSKYFFWTEIYEE